MSEKSGVWFELCSDVIIPVDLQVDRLYQFSWLVDNNLTVFDAIVPAHS